VLDIFHVLEKIAEASQTVHISNEEQAGHWLDEDRQTLLHDGWTGIEQHINKTLKRVR